MNILFYYESIALGGQQTQTLNVIKHFNREHNLFYAFNKDGELKEEFEKHCEVIDLGIELKKKGNRKEWPMFMLKSFIALNTLVKSNAMDVIISGSGMSSVISGLVARKNGIKHHRILGCSLKQVERFLYSNYSRFRIDSLIDKYYGPSSIFEELVEKGVSWNKFVNLPAGVNLEMFNPLSTVTRDAVRTELKIAKDTFVIGWVGRISKDMQIGNSILLLEELVKRNENNILLLIVGGGPWEEEMLSIITELGLDEHVVYLGWQPMLRVPELISAMDVVPLLEEDPRGGSILREAMACGKVIITVDGKSGAQREWVNHLDNGILVASDNFIDESASWIQKLKYDSHLYEKIGNSGVAYCKEKMGFEIQSTIIETQCLART